MKRLTFLVAVFASLVAAGPVMYASATAQQPSEAMQALSDRSAIHQLLMEYGRTIDERDFDAFGALFTEDGEYGGGSAMTKGPKAIANGMRAVFEANAMGFGEPNFHVFFNETIDLKGDRAESTSMSFFVVPGEDNLPKIVLMAEYSDELVRVDGGWKFMRREVRGLMPTRPGQ